LLVLRRYNPLRGEVFLSYVITYSIGRFFVEGMRTDSLYIGEIRVAHLISILLVVGTVALIVYRRKSGQAKKHYNGKSIKEKRSKCFSLKNISSLSLKDEGKLF